MFAKPQAEHHWLDKLVGKWVVESECQMGPDQPPAKMTALATCRSLGGLWAIIEGEGESPEGEAWNTIMTIGYDPQLNRYVGTFIGSMMTPLWLYSGMVDERGAKLTLDTEGPRLDEKGGTAKYQDIVEIVDDDHWVLSSQILGDDGTWSSFMAAHHRRIKE